MRVCLVLVRFHLKYPSLGVAGGWKKKQKFNNSDCSERKSTQLFCNIPSSSSSYTRVERFTLVYHQSIFFSLLFSMAISMKNLSPSSVTNFDSLDTRLGSRTKEDGNSLLLKYAVKA
jgi:hypothetical protein